MSAQDYTCGSFRFQCHFISDMGRVRKNNEDALIESPEAGLFGVCDGLGGHAAGEVASAIASETITREVEKVGGPAGSVLQKSLELANRRILEKQAANPLMRGMGTTVSLVWVSGEHDEVWVLHLGDSRVYQLHNGDISQVTDDHSPVYKLYQQGDLTKDQIRHHPQKNLLERSLGITSASSPDIFQLEASAGDQLLVCTDGLSDLLLDQEIESRLRKYPMQEAGGELVKEANRRGGTDNITIAQVQFLDVP